MLKYTSFSVFLWRKENNRALYGAWFVITTQKNAGDIDLSTLLAY